MLPPCGWGLGATTRLHFGIDVLVAPYRQLRADIAVLAAAGVEHLLLRFWTTASDLDVDGVVRQFELFAERVVPGLA